MKQSLLIFMIVMLPIVSFAQARLAKHYVNDHINSLTYLIFNENGTFDYRYVYDLMHDRATGKYTRFGDTILLIYNKDSSKTVLDTLNLQDKSRRADSLFIKKNKLYEIKNRVSMSDAKPLDLSGFKPSKSWHHRRKYILFGPYQLTDRYYMIDENFAVWANAKWLEKQKELYGN